MDQWMTLTMLLMGAATGWALQPYTAWIVSMRSGGSLVIRRAAPRGLVAVAPLINGIGWSLCWAFIPSHLEAMELALLITATLVLVDIDLRIRVIPNELVMALLVMSAAFALMEHGLSVLPLRLLGMAAALVLFLGTALMGLGKIGGGDIKLAMVIGFAAGWPNILVAVAAFGAAALASRLVDRQPWSIFLKTQLPFAGFLMIGLLTALILDRAQLLPRLLGA